MEKQKRKTKTFYWNNDNSFICINVSVRFLLCICNVLFEILSHDFVSKNKKKKYKRGKLLFSDSLTSSYFFFVVFFHVSLPDHTIGIVDKKKSRT